MAREAKFEFQDEKDLLNLIQVKAAEKHSVTINGKMGILAFSMDYIRDKGLNGGMIKLYADPSKKAIGWKILREQSLGGLEGYRKLTVYHHVNSKGHTQNRCILSIKPLLALLKAEKKTYKKIPVKTYKAPTILSTDLDYVEIK